MPAPGYWIKKAVGKETFQAALPARLPGMDNDVVVARPFDCNLFSKSKMKGLFPPPSTPPEFPEPIEAVRERIARAIGEISVPHQVRLWHPVIDCWLKEDAKRRKKQLAGASSSSLDKPQLDTPFEQRRLRILNSLFFAIQKMNGYVNVESTKRIPHLHSELIEARDEKKLLRFQKQIASYELLIVDELGFVPLSKTGAELLFEMLSQRYERGSTMVTSNLPFREWTEVLGSECLTGALLDRLTHHEHILEMNGDSYRLIRATLPDTECIRPSGA
jgi:hypothetical protein